MKETKYLRSLKELVNLKNLKILLKSKWVIFWVGPILTLIGIALVIWVGHLFTTHPTICLSCHARQSSLPMWSPSKIHTERVTCVNCHTKPGQLFPRFFFADERINENCLTCHKSVSEKEMEEIHHMKIAHKLHIEDSKLMCIDCHRNIAHEKFEEGTNRPKRLTCAECHWRFLLGSRLVIIFWLLSV